MNKKMAMMGVVCALLVGCGGSDDDLQTTPDPGPTPANTAEGFWLGSASTGTTVAFAVLENGDTWGVYTTPGGSILGALVGSTASSGGNLSGSGKEFDLYYRTVTPDTYSGTYVAGERISATLSNGTSFTGSYVPSYDEPASLTELAGTYFGAVATGSGEGYAPISISSSGAVSIPEDRGCRSSGTAKPRSSGKNIFDVSITFNGSSCVLGNGATVRGIAFYDATNRSLISLAVNNSQTDGLIFYGQK